MFTTARNILAARNPKRNDDGFTLIELLIVIVVLGILAAIVVFGLAQFQNNAQTRACQADQKQISTASDAWRTDLVANPNSNDPATVAFLTVAPHNYMKSEPTPTPNCTAAQLNAALAVGFVI